MLKILKRKAARGGVKRLREYFEGDFRSDMWDDAKGSPVETAPLVARFEPGEVQLPIWQPLKEDEFHSTLSAIRPKAADSVIAFELALAPPKSFSLAALAGGDLINTRLLQIHSKAAAEAYRLVAGFFMTRREVKKRKFLEPVPVQVWRFPHPWNRAQEPQLHEHHVILAIGDRGALHASPIYAHLRALRAAYHYTLVAELQAAGHVLRFGPPGSLVWELQGVSPEQLQLFAGRRKRMQEYADTIAGKYFSQGLEMQYAAFETRKELPKTDPLVSLRTQRQSWLSRLGALPVRVRRQDPLSQRAVIGDLTQHFHSNAIQTPLSVAGAVLAASLRSSTDSLQTVLEAVRKELEAGIERGEIVAGQHQTVCHRRVFRAEEQIRFLQRLRARTYDPGDIQFESQAPAGNPARRKLLHALSRPSAVKVLALGADTLPEVVSSSLRLPEFIRFPQWNPFAVLRELSRRRAQHVCLEVGQELYAHDFLETLVKGPWTSPPSASSISNARHLFLGSTTFEVEHLPELDCPLLNRCLFGSADDGGSSVVWVREEERGTPALTEKLGEWEQGRLRGRSVTARLLINHRLHVGETLDKRGMVYYFKKRFGPFARHSWARLHAGNLNKVTMMLESSEREKMELTDEKHRELLDLAYAGVDVFTASFGEVSLREGQQLQAGMDFNGGSWKVKRGELVRFDGLENDGAIRLADGRVLRGEVIPLQPAVAVRELAARARGCDRVVVFGSPDKPLLEQLRYARRKVVFVVDSPESIKPAREVIADWVEDRLLARHASSAAKAEETAQDPAEWRHSLFGSRAIWRKLTGLQKEVKKVVDVRSPFWLRLLDRQRVLISRLVKARTRRGEPQQDVVKALPERPATGIEQTME